jgi:hypothetical protein
MLFEFLEISILNIVNAIPDETQKGINKMKELKIISKRLSILPTGKTIFFKTLRVKTVIIGIIARITCKEIIIEILFLILLKNFPRYAPAPVNNIQLARIIPITNSLPNRTERNSRKRIICVITAVIPVIIIDNLIILCDDNFISSINDNNLY